MITLRGWSSRAAAARYFASEAAQEVSGDKVQRVNIPSAIKRGPTDLLKALSGTVGVDTTAPHFGLIDDPAMIPSTDQAKKTYFVAKEMGKRAARQLAQEWPTLFAFDRDQPRLPAFRPQNHPDPLQVEPTEANMLSMIQTRQVEDAIRLYERIRSGNVKISESTKLELFKLVCYYNCKNPPCAEVEEWHALRVFGEEIKSTWVESSIADLLFESLNASPQVVAIYIAGLCKHATPSSIAKALKLFKEHETSKLPIEAYEAIISVSAFKDALKVLKNLQKDNLAPRLETWNNLLLSASKITDFSEKTKIFKSIFGEMIHIGETPSLYSYDIVLNNLLPKETSSNASSSDTQLRLAVTWLADIISQLEKATKVSSQSAKDHLFFVNAMGIASRAGNLEVAERLVKVYEDDRNEVKMPAFTSEATFYNRYLVLYIEATQSIEDIFNKYISLVPRVVGTGRQLTVAICEKLKSNTHLPLLLRITEDTMAGRKLGDFILASMIRARLLDVSFNKLSVTERDTYSKAIIRMVNALEEFSNFTDERTKRLQLKFSPSSLVECALLLNRIGESDRAYQLIEKLLDQEASSGEAAVITATGYPKPAQIYELFSEAVKQGDGVRAALCLEVMSQNTPKAKLNTLVKEIEEKCSLNSEQNRLLSGFVRLRPE